ncbi:MAG: hypothetical protein FXF47_06380 [Candidatus Mcinerneyibacterium aminivorans]|uniref:Radical SAM protein n=1 Tax=Candidatus Mcinerneyibacterium aminivorans TaxID=2703815 RepID=A0A5D0MBH0_9BACT|nr:MAG: hypothetical protein FXF47_06380 [Candidatus Mcinerneyibacterium aminivorans]
MNFFLVFENYFEIKPFISNLETEKISNKLFLYKKNNINYYLFVNKTEGPLNLLDSLYFLKKEYKIDFIINLGIAGSIQKNLEKNRVYSIKTVTNINLNETKVLRPPIDTDIVLDQERDLLTVLYLQKGNKKKWKYFGDLVDMEGYFVAFFCDKYSIPLMILKSVSDYNDNINKSDNLEAANALYNYFVSNISYFQELGRGKYSLEIYKHIDFSLKNISDVNKLSSYLSSNKFSFTERNQIYNKIKINYNKSINNYFNNKKVLKDEKKNKNKGFLFIEENIKNKKRYTEKFSGYETVTVENYLDYFQYKIKRNYSNIFIANKKGSVIKHKPPKYGRKEFINVSVTNGYNCPFNCSYCYLKGWFRSDDIVIFANKEYIWSRMKKFIQNHEDKKIIFYFGDFCDALAFDKITENVKYFSEKIKDIKNVLIEFRTKSINYSHLIDMDLASNIIIAYSITPQKIITRNEKNTANLKQRLQALRALNDSNKTISVHFDPIIYYENYYKDYKSIIKKISNIIDEKNLFSISVGVLRMPKKVYKTIKNNEPTSVLKDLKKEKSMYRYSKKLRDNIYDKIKNELMKNFNENKIYICMD